MNEISNQTYYTAILPAILVSLPILYVAITILWNRKWVPRQRAKGAVIQNFGMMFANAVRVGLREDTLKLLPKVDNKFTNTFLSLKAVNWLLIILTLALLGLKNENAWLPFVFLIASVWIRTTPILNQRKQVLQRMFAVASSVFRYGRGADLEPWKYVKIKKWETFTVPGETHVSIPATWDASSLVARDGFERHFKTTVTDSNSWIYEWKSADGIVICRPINHLPTMAEYQGSAKYEWSQIPLGIGSQGEVSVDLTKTPHMLICGSTGSGKSVLQRNLIFHCIQHNDMWRFLGVDVKRVELTPFKRYTQTVLGIGANLEDGVDIVRYAKKVMETRYEKMEEAGVNHFKDMIDPATGKPHYAIMLMIDEAFMFMSPEGAKTDEGKVRDQLHGEASSMLGDIARLGRAAGIHLVLATQRPDATVIKGELKANLDIRIAAGRLDATPSMMVLDSGAATMLPGDIKGRGIVRFGGEQTQFQGYFAPQEWIDGWLQQNPGREPEIYPATNGAGEGTVIDELAALGDGFNFEDGITEEPVEEVSAFQANLEQAAANQSQIPNPVQTTSQPYTVVQPELPIEQIQAAPEPASQPVPVQNNFPTPSPVQNPEPLPVAEPEVDDEMKSFIDRFLGDEEEVEATVEAPKQANTVPTPPTLAPAPLTNARPPLPKLPSLPPINRPSLPPLPNRNASGGSN